MKTYNSIDDYIVAQPTEYRANLEKIRQTIKQVAPEAVEYIGYGMGSNIAGSLSYISLVQKNISDFIRHQDQ